MGDQKIEDGASSDQVFLEDPFKDLGCAGVIPDPLGVDDGDGAVLADLKAIGLGAVNAPHPDQIQFLEPFFEIVPRLEADFFGTAIGLGLIGAEKDVPADRRDFHDEPPKIKD